MVYWFDPLPIISNDLHIMSIVKIYVLTSRSLRCLRSSSFSAFDSSVTRESADLDLIRRALLLTDDEDSKFTGTGGKRRLCFLADESADEDGDSILDGVLTAELPFSGSDLVPTGLPMPDLMAAGDVESNGGKRCFVAVTSPLSTAS